MSDSLCFPPVLSWYRRPTELSVSGSKSKRESGKLPLALSQHGDFPLLWPPVSVWLFPNKTLNLDKNSHYPTTFSITTPFPKTKLLLTQNNSLIAPASFQTTVCHIQQQCWLCYGNIFFSLQDCAPGINVGILSFKQLFWKGLSFTDGRNCNSDHVDIRVHDV